MPIFSTRQQADIESKLFNDQASDADHRADVIGRSVDTPASSATWLASEIALRHPEERTNIPH
jgi:hypothetical protein